MLTCNFVSFLHDLSCRTCPVHALFRFRFALQLNICSCPPGVVWRGTHSSRDTTLHDLSRHFATYRASVLAIRYSLSRSASLFSTWLHSVTSWGSYQKTALIPSHSSNEVDVRLKSSHPCEFYAPYLGPLVVSSSMNNSAIVTKQYEIVH